VGSEMCIRDRGRGEEQVKKGGRKPIVEGSSQDWLGQRRE
jgi:hypothetical protein